MYHDEYNVRTEGGVDPRYALLATIWAIGTVAILIGIKAYAYWMSGSTAMLGSLTDSFTDAGLSVMMLLALRYSLKPADKTHRHGHGKAEGLAALFQGGFLGGAAFFLVLQSLKHLAEPEPVTAHGLGITIACISIVLSLILVGVQTYCYKRAPSLAVSADRAHYTTDIWLDGAVILTLVAHFYGGPGWLDPVCGLGIAAYLGWTGVKVGKEAADMLMDRELPDAVRQRILTIVKDHQDVMGIHDLRTRKVGMVLHISFDVELDPALSLRDAHAISRELEMRIMADYPYAEIIIHKDPFGDPHDARHTVEGVHH